MRATAKMMHPSIAKRYINGLCKGGAIGIISLSHDEPGPTELATSKTSESSSSQNQNELRKGGPK